MTLVFAAALAASLVQDDRLEMKWTAEKGDRFDVKWSYDDANIRQPGLGPRIDLVDRRTVEAELEPAEEANRFTLRLKKVAWTVAHPEYDIQLTYQAGKPVVKQVKVKADPKASSADSSRSQAEHVGELMVKQVTEGDYQLVFDPVNGRSMITRNGSAGRNTSVLDRVFMHGTLLKGSITAGHAWKEEVDDVAFPQLVENRTISCKVDVKRDLLTVKGGFQAPVSQIGSLDSITGSFTFAREYSFHKEGYLSASKEESVFTKKADTKRKDEGAQGFRENSTHTIKQSLVVKKRPAPKQE